MAKKNLVNLETISEIITEEVGKLDWGGREVRIEDSPSFFIQLSVGSFTESPLAFVFADKQEVVFYAGEIANKINQTPGLDKLYGADSLFWKGLRFLNSILGGKKTLEEVLQAVVHVIVIHEHRHTQQYDFLASKGLDVVRIIREENETLKYKDRPTEKDAFMYQKGKVRPLEKALAMYLK